jgi:hypothetical protein
MTNGEWMRSKSYVTTDGQSASLSWNKAPISGLRPDIYYCQTVPGLLMWGALSDERTGLSFTIAAGPRQRSHSRVRVPWDSWHFTVSDSRFPQSRGSGPRIYILQGQSGPAISPGTGFPFRRLLRLARLRWRYSTPPPQGLQYPPPRKYWLFVKRTSRLIMWLKITSMYSENWNKHIAALE